MFAVAIVAFVIIIVVCCVVSVIPWIKLDIHWTITVVYEIVEKKINPDIFKTVVRLPLAEVKVIWNSLSYVIQSLMHISNRIFQLRPWLQ